MSYTKKHDFDEKVVDRIIDYLNEKNVSIRKLSGMTGMTYNQMYQVLKKNQLIKLREYLKICKALDVDVERFLNEEDL